MKLSIYSLQKILYQGQAKSLSCNTAMGQIMVLDNHEPLIAVLAKGVLKVGDTENKEQFFNVAGGFLEVKPGNQVRCIVD